MPDSRQPGRAGRKFPVPLVLAAASLLILSFSTGSIKEIRRGVGMTITGSVQRLISGIGQAVSGGIASIRGRKELYDQYVELAKRIEYYANLEREHADLKQENERLLRQLGYQESNPGTLIPARIIAKSPDSQYQRYTIDGGSADGIRKNMPVVAFQDGLEGVVGKVLEVGATTSAVVPLYDARLFIASRLARTRFEGLTGGQGTISDPLVMKYVGKLSSEEVQFGDLVVTSGLDSIYPPDIAVGRVKSVSMEEYQSSADILVDPVLDLGRLEFVFVVSGSGPAAATGGTP